MIKIKLNQYAHIYNAGTDVRSRLREELKVVNPVWADNERMNRWNRDTPQYLYMYDETRERFSVPAAYVEEVQSLITDMNYRFDFYDMRVNAPAAFNFRGDLRSFQKPACRRLMQFDTGTLEAPTGSGKTVMGLYVIAARRQKTLVIVHTKDLAHQWIDRASEFLDIQPNEVGLIGAGKKKLGARLTIGLVQSIYTRIDELGGLFGHLVLDECHRAPSRTFTEAANGFNCTFRLGLSATPFRRDGLTRLIFWHAGPRRFTVSKNRLYEEGHIMEPIFVMRSTNFISEFDAVSEYSRMLSDLAANDERNDMICIDISDEAEHTKNNCLILTDRKEHCRALKDRLIQKYGVDALVMTGSTRADRRKQIISQIGRTHRFLIATGQLIGEGFDCKNLNVMFLATPIKFSGRVLQYIGRVMRPAEGKDRPIVYDYVDARIPTLKKSAKARIKVYGKKNIVEE